MKNILYQVTKELQKTIEETLNGSTVGTCYLSGHCLAVIFEKLGFKSRKVTGKLALLMKNGKSKYITYGKTSLKGFQVGDYHTWCEVTHNGVTYIIDPSLKVNKAFIRNFFGIKINPMVEKDILISSDNNTYYYKYYEDARLNSASEKCLATLVTPVQIDSIIVSTIANIQYLFKKKSA